MVSQSESFAYADFALLEMRIHSINMVVAGRVTKRPRERDDGGLALLRFVHAVFQ